MNLIVKQRTFKYEQVGLIHACLFSYRHLLDFKSVEIKYSYGTSQSVNNQSAEKTMAYAADCGSFPLRHEKRCRPACTFGQSDQCLCYSLPAKYDNLLHT